MLRVVEQYSGTDTGRQRRANEDSLLARPPLFVVADGMGGAQAGEVASRIAVEAFQAGLDGSEPERALLGAGPDGQHPHPRALPEDAEHAGMGTTLTARLRRRARRSRSPTSATAAPTACGRASSCA